MQPGMRRRNAISTDYKSCIGRALELGEIRGFVQRGQWDYLRTYKSRAGERGAAIRRLHGAGLGTVKKDTITISDIKVID
jgi:hypothetical protein